MKLNLLLGCLLLTSSLLLGNPFDEAVAAFEHGDFASAEASLRLLLKSNPANAPALGLLGAVLDSEKRFAEAENAYRGAIRLTPRSATLLNNYANHQLTMGNRVAARATYLKVVTIDPARANANLQLAQFAVEDKDGTEALRYCQHLPAEAAKEPQVEILRLQALYLTKNEAAASKLNAGLEAVPDPKISFSAGLGLTSIGRYTEAERFFSRALELAPGNFDVLYNLGLAAFHAGHMAAASKALQDALTERPKDVDVLFNLAAVAIEQKQQEQALHLLAEAGQIDSVRADVQLALGHTASALGYYADARLAYERYLQIKPKDTEAEREHLFTVALSEQPQVGLVALKAFSERHRQDAAAHYEVGVLEAKSEPADAAAQFAAALHWQPGYMPAKLGRGTLNYLQGKPGLALPDLESAAAQYPDNAAVLDRLGEVYNALNRPSEAVAALSRAASLAPRDARVLMHLSRAQSKAGDNDGARATLARFRALGPQPGNLIPQAGVVDFLGLPAEQQQARYSEEVKRRIEEQPDNPDLNMRYLQVLMSEGRTSDIGAAVQHLVELHPPALIALESGEAMVEGGQYGAAKPLLDYAASEAPKDSSIQLDLAVVDLHREGVAAAEGRLNQVSGNMHMGDVLLARGLVMECAGRSADAKAAFTEAEKLRPASILLYQEAVQALVQHGHPDDAMKLVKLAESLLPKSSQTDQLRARLAY